MPDIPVYYGLWVSHLDPDLLSGIPFMEDLFMTHGLLSRHVTFQSSMPMPDRMITYRSGHPFDLKLTEALRRGVLRMLFENVCEQERSPRPRPKTMKPRGEARRHRPQKFHRTEQNAAKQESLNKPPQYAHHDRYNRSSIQISF
jgi:hypothetical protein